MYIAIILIFALGYLTIALENVLKINKTATALFMGVICWVLLAFGGHLLIPEIASGNTAEVIQDALLEHVGEISEILFFLLGAMTIVELIDAHEGFAIITKNIRTVNQTKLLWILAILAFFLSAILDNLTTSIVMAALLRKMIKDKQTLWIFASMVIIAANAGGAWSPIGDVTTIMLWIGGQVTTPNLIAQIFIPSLVAALIPLLIFGFQMRGKTLSDHENDDDIENEDIVRTSKTERATVFGVGIAALLFVPIFKNLTELPPFMGVLLGLSVMWILTEIIHKKKEENERWALSIEGVLQRIDTPSILFFLGILMAVAALQTGGILADLSGVLDANFNNVYAINGLIGLLSSIIDNVPLVAATMGMYSTDVYAVDHQFWHLLAYCAGTGGSILIIGSAAGVAIMGIFKIDFLWYLKKISWVALLGYASGILTLWLLA